MLLLFGLLLVPLSGASAQSVSVTPVSSSVGLGKTIQFSATLTGITGDVAWFCAGVKGGTAAAGKISTTGLYTAPTVMPAQNPVQIKATSKVNSTKSAIVYVDLLSAGPTISAVSPNPLNTGAITVTITGAGFLPNAAVFESSDGNVPIQLSTTNVTSTSITATGYQGAATTASFGVRNPGSDFSNYIQVPISAATKYTLTVVNGSGSGSYAAGTVVTIKANTPPAGQTFLNWTGATVASATSATTTITMPADNKTVTANYTSATSGTYALTVVNGTGSGSYAPGTVVTIKANAAPAGQTFLNWTGATVANANAASTTLTMPSAAVTVTANYKAVAAYTLTVVNGTGSGSYAAGTHVSITANTPPAGQLFVNWTGATVTNSTAATTDLTMPAANTTVTANFAVPAAIPYPVSSHPRLWITPADLTRLQSWAVPSNKIYAQGMVPLLNQVVNLYTTQFFPNGVQNPNYPDPGDTQGYVGNLTEEVGLVLAFNSLIDPNAANRIKYAQYARNILMVAMNQAALGHLDGAPWRDRLFAVYNHANQTGMEWPLIVDWIYNAKDAQGNAILTASDKATIRKAFMIWCDDCTNASTTGGDSPQVHGVINSHQLLPGNAAYRYASNNYYLGHARMLTMMALCIDPADDPAVNSSQPASVLGNSLRSYIPNATGAWLYQEFAMMGDPVPTANALGIPGNPGGFGLASGGLPPEGMLYGHSYGYILGQLLALQTAGFNDTTLSGPQAGLIGAPVWDRYVKGYLSSLIPAAIVDPSQTYLGPVYQFAAYGDILRIWVTPDAMQSFTLLALLDQENGKTSNMNAARWLSVTANEGGPTALMSRITQPWSYGVSDALLYFMLLDPAAPTATDPRPSYPTTFVDPAAGRVVSHSDWSPMSNMFDYRASWESINHQDCDGGQFELYRKGEWLTKEMSNYDNNALGLTTVYHNTLSIQNYSANGTPSLQWYEQGEWANGSQWMLGQNAGDPTTVTSSGANYVYASSDLTNLYNRPNIFTPAAGATNVSQATRSIIWLNNDYIVVYDRATTLNSGLFKRFNLSLVTNPVINGKTATETLGSGQKLFIQTLLPQNAAFSSFNGAVNMNPIAQMEPSKYILQIEDPTKPADTRFLHVLQGADPGAAMVAATYTNNSAGTAFDGAVFGSSAAYFPVSATTAFTGTALPAPTGVHTLFVAGLAPNTTYGVSISANTVTVTPTGTGGSTDAAGLMKLTF